MMTIAQATGSAPFLSVLGVPPRARVWIVEDPRATQAFKPVPDRVAGLLEGGLTNLTGQTSVTAAWRSLVSTQDVVGIKVFCGPGPHSGTRLTVVDGVVQGLMRAGLPPRHIIVWDKHLDDLRRTGFTDLAERHGVRAAGSIEAGWDENVSYEMPVLGQLVYGDYQFNKTEGNVGRKSFVSKLVSGEITKIISIPPLLNHNSVGVCGNLYSVALGSVDNTLRFEGEPHLLAQAVPEIYALPCLGDRVVLNIVDALVCQYQGEQIEHLHYATPLNQLRFSTDPVALDVLSICELNQQRELKGVSLQTSTNALELYQNASLLEIGASDPRQIEVMTLKLNR